MPTRFSHAARQRQALGVNQATLRASGFHAPGARNGDRPVSARDHVDPMDTSGQERFSASPGRVDDRSLCAEKTEDFASIGPMKKRAALLDAKRGKARIAVASEVQFEPASTRAGVLCTGLAAGCRCDWLGHRRGSLLRTAARSEYECGNRRDRDVTSGGRGSPGRYRTRQRCAGATATREPLAREGHNSPQEKGHRLPQSSFPAPVDRRTFAALVAHAVSVDPVGADRTRVGRMSGPGVLTRSPVCAVDHLTGRGEVNGSASTLSTRE
jgi:hypothetical protein